MNSFQALILGIVQGITEFLPISSTAHLRIVPAMLGWSDPGAAYSAIIQLGTTLAVMVFFARDIWMIGRDWVRGIIDRKPFGTFEARLGWYIIAGTLPVVAAGLLLKKFVEGSFRSLYVIAGALIVLALILTAAERLARHARDLKSVTLRDGVVVGLAQAMALVPGSSRSGVTLTAGLFLGLKRDAAARFSFLLSIPATFAAGVYELRHAFHAPEGGPALAAAPLIVGTVASFVFGYASIAGLLRFLQTRTTMVFIVYRVLLGIAIVGLISWGVLHA